MTDTSLALPGVPHHAAVAHSSSNELAWKWFRTLRWHLLLLFWSDLGRKIIERKYDAFTTDQAYENRPKGKWLIGRCIDWLVLRQDTHVALRQRLAIVVDELSRAALELRDQGVQPVHLVSGPCGLARDLRLAWAKLKAKDPACSEWLQLTGLDLDQSGETLPAARQLADAVQVPLALENQDLLDASGLRERFADRPVHLFLSMGLTVWLAPADLPVFLTGVYDLLEPGGLFLVDYFRHHSSARYLDDFEMKAPYLPDAEYEALLTQAGFHIEAKQETANQVNVVYRLRKPY